MLAEPKILTEPPPGDDADDEQIEIDEMPLAYSQRELDHRLAHLRRGLLRDKRKQVQRAADEAYAKGVEAGAAAAVIATLTRLNILVPR